MSHLGPQPFAPAYEQAQREGFDPVEYARIQRLRRLSRHLGNRASGQAPSGYVADISRLASYTWEGVGMGMIFNLIGYLFQTLMMPPHMKEQMIYEGLDQDLKLQPNEDGQYPVLYRPYLDANDDVRFSNEDPIDTPEAFNALSEVEKYYFCAANGYMYKPNAELGAQFRYEDLMEKMMGFRMRDPLFDAIMDSVSKGRSNGPRQNEDQRLRDGMGAGILR